MSTNATNDGQAGGKPSAYGQYVLVGVLAAVVVFWQLGTSIMEDHECHLALTARAMADANGDNWLVASDLDYQVPPRTTLNRWAVPVENGQPRLVKTPLPYWSAAAIAIATGEGVTNWTARAPAAICAVLLALVTLAMGRRMLSPRAALLGALMLVACLGFQKWGRDARPEMTLCLLTNVAMLCFYLGIEATTRRAHVLWMAAFWVSMGLANLAKEFVPLLLAWSLFGYLFWRQTAQGGDDAKALRLLRVFLIASAVGLAVHLAVMSLNSLQWWRHTQLSDNKGAYLTMAVCLGLPMLGYFVAAAGWRPIIRLLPTAVPGIVVMLALFVPWMLYMSHLFPNLAGKVLADQVTERAAGSGKWTVAPPHVYVLSLLTMTLPWLAFVPGAFAVGLMRRFSERRRGLVFLLLWSLGLMALFTSAAAKREHYILPMIPAFCLLMGFVAEDVFFRHAWIKPAFARLIGASYGIVGLAGVPAMAIAWLVDRHDATWPVMLVSVALAAVPWTLAGLLAWRGQLRSVMGLIVAGMLIIFLGHWSFIRLYDDRLPIRDFAVEAAAIVKDDPVVHWGDPQSKTVFYFGRSIPVAQWPFQRQDPNADDARVGQMLTQWIAANPSRMPWIIGYADIAETMASLGYKPALTKQDIQAKKLLFTLYHRVGATTLPAGEGR